MNIIKGDNSNPILEKYGVFNVSIIMDNVCYMAKGVSNRNINKEFFTIIFMFDTRDVSWYYTDKDERDKAYELISTTSITISDKVSGISL